MVVAAVVDVAWPEVVDAGVAGAAVGVTAMASLHRLCAAATGARAGVGRSARIDWLIARA